MGWPVTIGAQPGTVVVVTPKSDVVVIIGSVNVEDVPGSVGSVNRVEVLAPVLVLDALVVVVVTEPVESSDEASATKASTLASIAARSLSVAHPPRDSAMFIALVKRA